MFKNVAAVFEYLLPTVSKHAFRYTDSRLDSLMHPVYISDNGRSVIKENENKDSSTLQIREAKFSGSRVKKTLLFQPTAQTREERGEN